MGSGESYVTEGDGGGKGGATEVASSCSICLDAVITGGGRSTAKLQCGHEFHLDCIGSAFNTKGMMQCPNCRNVEEGNWLHVTSFNTDEWTHDDELYDLNFLEMPYTIRWCPVNRIGRVSFENGDSFPSVAFQDLAGHHVITELPSISVPAQPCPHLSGFHQAQPSSAPIFHDAISEANFYYHLWRHIADSDAEVPSPLSSRTSDASHYHGQDRYQATQFHPRDIAAASNQAPVSAPRSARLEDGRPHRAGSLYYSRHGFLPVLPYLSSSNRAPARTQELHPQANMMADPWRSGNSAGLTFTGRSLRPPSNHLGVYMYPLPVSFNSSIGDMMNTGAQFGRSRVQFVPFTPQQTLLMEIGSFTAPRRS